MIIDYRNKVGFCSLSSSKCSLISWEAQMKYDIGLDCNMYDETLFVTQRYLTLNNIRELGLDISINNIHTVTTGVTSGAGTANPSEAPEFNSGF
jgi:hypothetical protein